MVLSHSFQHLSCDNTLDLIEESMQKYHMSTQIEMSLFLQSRNVPSSFPYLPDITKVETTIQGSLYKNNKFISIIKYGVPRICHPFFLLKPTSLKIDINERDE